MKLIVVLLTAVLCLSYSTVDSTKAFATAWQLSIKQSITRQLEDKQSIGDKEELRQIAHYYDAEEVGNYHVDFLHYLQTVNPVLWQQMQHKDVLLLNASMSGERAVMRMIVIVVKSEKGYQACHFSGTGSWQFDKKSFWSFKKADAARNAKQCPYAGRNSDEVVVTIRSGKSGQFSSMFFTRGSLCANALIAGDWTDEGW